MKNFLAIVMSCSIFCTSLLMSGCAGRDAWPVSTYQPGDEKRSCGALRAEYSNNETQVRVLQQEDGAKGWWNAGMFIGGLFIIVPFFFMDLKGSQKMEIAALKQRNTNLMAMGSDRDCDFCGATPKPVAVAVPAGK